MPDKDSRAVAESIRTRVVQVSNISPSATREQLHQMFSYLGRIDEMKVYPSETNPLCATSLSRLCYVKFEDTESVATAQHLTNTPLIDRAIMCVPVPEDRIPDEETALRIGGPALPGQRVLPSHVINQIQMVGGKQAMVTIDPTMSQMGVPNYPPLPSNTDAGKLEEIRRTVYVGSISKDASTNDLLDFFNKEIGEVMYMRFAGDDDLPFFYLYVEFANQMSVPVALQKNGIEFRGSKLKIQHSTQAIVKPRAKTEDMAKREVEEAIRKAEAAGPLSKALGGVDADEAVRRYGSKSSLDSATMRAVASITRSRSPSWGRGDVRRSRGRSSRSRSPRGRGRVSRSPSPRSRRRRRTRSPSPRRRSRDRDRGGRRRSPSRDRDRDRDWDRRRRTSRSPSDRRRSRDRDRDRSERDRDRNRERVDREREKGKEKEKEKRDKDRKDKDKEKEREKETKGSKKEPSTNKEKDRQAETSKSKSGRVKEERVEASKAEMETKPAESPVAETTSKEDSTKPKSSELEENEDLTLMEIEEHRKEESIKKGPTPSKSLNLYEDRMEHEEISEDDGSEMARSRPEPMVEEEKAQSSKSKEEKASRKKEKRKKEKKEKKKKRDRSSKKKKAAKARNESGASEDDGASTSSSE